MKTIVKFTCFLLSAILLSAIFSGCQVFNKSQAGDTAVFASFRDIPGMTAEDIKAVEQVLAQRSSFSYGMMLSTEAFLDAGEIRGYSALVCEWLTDLFGVPFIPEITTWENVLAGLESGTLDFSGTVTATDERRRQGFFLTDPIALRWVKYFTISGSEPLSEIAKTRLPRYALLQNAVSAQNAMLYAIEEFEPVFVTEYIEAYELLRKGEVDALLAESSAEAIFDIYGNIVTSDFYPLIYSPASLASRNSELAPIIDTIQKALENGANVHLSELFDLGRKEYTKFKLFSQLTPEELDYIRKNPVIPLGAEYDNYPVSFYSERYGGWEGIAFDVLDEIEWLTGLKFNVVNDERTNFFELLRMLEAGEAYIVSEVIQSPDRRGRFLWPAKSFRAEQSVLISTVNLPNLNANRIYSVTVGLVKENAHTEFFFRYFPNHPNTVTYDNQDDARDALINGEIDMIMNSYSTLLSLTNYQELVDFKANIIFNNSYESTFGINKEQVLLCSIVDKALELIDTNTISEQWMHRNYDYRYRLLQAQRPWMLGAAALSLCVLVLVAAFLVRSRRTGKRLELLVGKRTSELAVQTATLTTLFDSIPAHIFIKDLNLSYTQVNESLLKHFGRSKEDIIGKDDIEGLGVPAAVADAFRKIDRRVIEENCNIIVEENVPSVDGRNPTYEITKAPLTLDGSIIGVLGISHDITERKKMERITAAKYDYANKLSDALAKITNSPTIHAGDLKAAADVIVQEACIALNSNHVSIWNLSEDSEALINITCYRCATGSHSVLDDFDLTRRQKYAKLLKSRRLIITNNIHESSYDITIDGYGLELCAMLDAPIRIDGNLVGVICVEQNRSEEYPESREWTTEEQSFTSSLADLMALAISGYERHKAREEAEIANQTKSTFLANMSHEIRTPMNAILGVTEILIQNENLSHETEEALGKIYNSCEMLLGIINDILDFSKIEAGKLDIIPSKYKTASLINDSAHLNMMRIESKPISFELEIDEKIPAVLIGDELRIKQILNNLLSNAFKYTDRGKVTLSVTFEPVFSEVLGENGDEIRVIFSVSDTGQGMTEEQLKKLFDEYSRFNEEAFKSIEGTGLGLAITQRLVNLMDGKIQVESQPGKGSLFTVSLLQKKAGSEVLGSELAENLRNFRVNYMTHRERSQIARVPMPYGKVLIVDDVETNLYVAVGLMKLYRLQIDTVMSGQEAIDKVKAGNTFDIIFMDHMMPEMDGMEATKLLRDLGYSAPIVALTANAVAGQADIFLKSGFDDFISKPIDIRQLDAILNKLVRDKQPPEVLEAARRQMKQSSTEANENNMVDSLLLESFIRDGQKAVAVLEELCEKNGFEDSEEDLRNFTIFVHGIKSSLRNIGETELSDTAYKLETAGREKNVSLLSRVAPKFLKNLRELITSLEEKRGEADENNAGEDAGDIRAKLLTVKEMCADYNRKGALDIIAEIKNCSKETRDVLEKIKEFALHSDFDEAESAAAAYIAALSERSEKQEARLQSAEISGIDITKGLERYLGDEDTYLKILRSYSAGARSMLDALETFSAEALRDYEIKVHGLKGSSYDIFAEQIGKTAERLEEAAKAGDTDYINEHNSAFIEAARKLIFDLDAVLSAIDSKNPKPKKDKADSEVLAKLLAACKIYDMDGADAAMDEIEKYDYISDSGLVSFLREKFDMMKFGEIVEKLS